MPSTLFRTHLIDTEGGSRLAIHATEGSRSLPCVLLVASPGVGPVFFRRQVDYLASRFRFVTWTYRGLLHGNAGASVEDHARDAAAVLDAVGAHTAEVVAWSVGAVVALELAQSWASRVDDLVLLNPTYPRAYGARLGIPPGRIVFPGALRAADRLLPIFGRLRAHVGPWPETAAWLKRLGLASETLDDELFADVAAESRAVEARRYADVVAGFTRHADAPPLESLRLRALVVAGTADPLLSPLAARRIARRLPYGELFLVKGGTHYTPLEYPEFVNLRVEKFLDAQAALREERRAGR